MTTYEPARAEEYTDCLQLMMDAAGYLEGTLELMELSVEQFGQLFRTVGEVFIVREGDEMAGFYWIEKRDTVLHLHGLILKEAIRGRGIGTGILRRLETSHGTGVDVIELGVHRSNVRAIALYERSGFRTVRTLDDLGFHVMQKPLATPLPPAP